MPSLNPSCLLSQSWGCIGSDTIHESRTQLCEFSVENGVEGEGFCGPSLKMEGMLLDRLHNPGSQSAIPIVARFGSSCVAVSPHSHKGFKGFKAEI